MYRKILSLTSLLVISSFCIVISLKNINQKSMNFDDLFRDYKHETSDMIIDRLSIPQTFLNNFTTYYFSHLNQNGPMNRFGSCGYVSITSYLSFCDSFFSDQIIDSSYEALTDSISSSPGVNSETCFSEMNVLDYRNCLMSNNFNNYYTNNYLQFLLFKIAHQFDSTIGSLSIEDGTTDINLGTNFDLMRDVLEEYLFSSTYVNLSENDFTLNCIKTDNYQVNRERVIEKLLSGLPIIVGIPGHVAIAYDYDTQNDTIYLYNNGIYDKHFPLTDIITDYYYIEPLNQVNHIYHYNINNEYLCHCDFNFHSHFNTLMPYNLLKHKVYCHCGNYTLENHNYSLSTPYSIGARRYINCYLCGAMKDITNDFVPVIRDSADGVDYE